MKEFTVKKDVKGYSAYLDITGDYMFTTDSMDKAEKIIKCLEKTIPRKIFRHPWNGIHGKPYDLCPNCGSLCEDDKQNCNNCGQKLDWEV